jgi:hypothetical protein
MTVDFAGHLCPPFRLPKLSFPNLELFGSFLAAAFFGRLGRSRAPDSMWRENA